MRAQGWVYILHHPDLPVAKIGSSINPSERAVRQGMPLIHAVASPSWSVVERAVHGLLSAHRYEHGSNREWFHLEPASRLFPEAIHQAVAEEVAGRSCELLLSLQRVSESITRKTRSAELLSLAARSYRRSVDRRSWREIFGADLVPFPKRRDRLGRFAEAQDSRPTSTSETKTLVSGSE